MNDMKDIIVDTFVPKWLTGAPAQPKRSEANTLDDFRQRIYMQQVIWVVILLFYATYLCLWFIK